MKEQLRSFIVAIGLMFISLTVGVGGFMIIEGYDLLNAFYMAVITISTVGFTEVYELSPSGRLFTSIYIIFNLGILAFVVSVLTSYLFEGKLRSVFSNYMNERELNKLHDHVIVCGYGRNGSQACAELIQEGRSFVIIDKDPEIFQNDNSELKSKVLIGDATEDETLKLGGIERAKEIIITTPSDASNVFITLTARELKPDIMIIARASDKNTEPKLYRAGADRVIMPDHLGGMFMAQMITKPAVIEFLDLLTGRGRSRQKYILEPISYQDLKPEFRDKTLRELNLRRLTGATVIAVKDNIEGLIPNPSGDTFIGVDDTMIILCEEEASEGLIHFLTD